jgi:hypothetical protein
VHNYEERKRPHAIVIFDGEYRCPDGGRVYIVEEE